ncbi:hypothetical protein RJ640_023690 [Escallonia rubra]|uniref:Uncharacterized protein n=1 Tax=Escallonia rubra TaxID=112253 RepID=A0AA88UL90_9ASTE|nr:hypothetical protein RJ640_023690 [Escallonia rubra]
MVLCRRWIDGVMSDEYRITRFMGLKLMETFVGLAFIDGGSWRLAIMVVVIGVGIRGIHFTADLTTPLNVDREGLVTKSAQFDLSPLFEENNRVDLSPLFEENKKEEMRFAPASCVILKLEEVAKVVKFGVRLQGLENGGRGNWAD